MAVAESLIDRVMFQRRSWRKLSGDVPRHHLLSGRRNPGDARTRDDLPIDELHCVLFRLSEDRLSPSIIISDSPNFQVYQSLLSLIGVLT